MRERPSLIPVVLAIIYMTVALPNSILADVSMIRPETEIKRTYYLNQGDVIAWDWKLIGEGDVDFWIEDSEGSRYEFIDNATRNSGSFRTPHAGEWNVKFHNDSSDPAGATINYDIRINPTSNGLILTAIVIGIIAIIVSVVVSVTLLLRRRVKQV